MKRPMRSGGVLTIYLLLGVSVFGSLAGGEDIDIDDIRGLEMVSLENDNFDLPSGHCFIENLGQWDPSIRFVGDTSFGRVGITNNGMIYDIARMADDKGNDPMEQRFDHPQRNEIIRDVIKVSFKDSTESEIRGKGPLTQRYNYFLGNDPEKWVSGAIGYEEVVLENIYDGVDARYYFNDGDLKYDLILDPFTDPDQIQMKVEGAGDLLVENDLVSIGGSDGPLIHDSSILVFSEEYDPISAGFRSQGDMTYGFQLEEYDNSKKIVIDPILSSAFYEGTNWDMINSIDSTPSGGYIVTGNTRSPDFPVTPGAYQEEYPNKTQYSEEIAIIMGFSEGIGSLLFSTFFGGNGTEWGNDVMVDLDGSFLVYGTTTSPDFPLTDGVYDNETNGGYDCFLSKFSSSGSSLEFSTILGGERNDRAKRMELGGNGWIYLTGNTQSPDFPQTAQIKNLSYPSSLQSFFICQIDDKGTSLRRSLVFNGTSWVDASDLRILENGNLLVCAVAGLFDIRTTAGCLNITGNTTNAWNTNIFIMEVDLDSYQVERCARIGGDGRDLSYSFALDDQGDIWIGGLTNSPDFPVTEDCFGSMLGEEYDILLLELDRNMTELKYSTYIPGDGDEYSISVDVDPAVGRIYASGKSFSGDLYTTDDALQDRSSGTSNGYLFVFDTEDHSLVHSTYLTSSGGEFLNDIQCRGNDTVAIGGCSFGGDFPQGPSHIENRTDEYYYTILFEYQLPMLPQPPQDLSYDHYQSGEKWYVNLTWSPPDDPGNGELIEYKIYYSDDFDDGILITHFGYSRTTPENWFVFDFTNPAYEWSFGVEMITETGTSNISEIITIYDEIPPEIIADHSDSNFTGDDYVRFRLNVTDNYAVKKVLIHYHQDDGIEHNRSLGKVDPWRFEGQIYFELKDGDVHYRFEVTDQGNNKIQTENRTVKVLDVTPPEIQSDNTVKVVEAGEEIQINVTIDDNYELASVLLRIELGNISEKFMMENLEGDNWTFTYLPSTNSTFFNYNITVFDQFNNTVSMEDTVTIIDSFPPVLIKDLSDRVIKIDQDFKVSAIIEDPSGVSSVKVQYLFSGGGQDLIHEMALTNVNGTYEYNLVIPWWNQDPMTWSNDLYLSYRFMAWDNNERRLTTNWTNVYVTEDLDIIDLEFHHLSFCTTGDLFRFSVGIAPNMTYDLVSLHLWTNTSSIDETEYMWKDTDGSDDLISEISVPLYSLETIWYEVIVHTENDLNLTFGPFSLDVIDNKAPVVSYIENLRVQINTDLRVQINANDNIGINMTIWEVGSSAYNGEVLNYHANREGNFPVTVRVYDEAGNFGIRHFNIEVYSPDEDPPVEVTPIESDQNYMTVCILVIVILLVVIILVAKVMKKEKRELSTGSSPALSIPEKKMIEGDEDSVLMVPFDRKEGKEILIDDSEDEGPIPWENEDDLEGSLDDLEEESSSENKIDMVDDEDDLDIEEEEDQLKINVPGEGVMKIKAPTESDPGPRLAPPPPPEDDL